MADQPRAADVEHEWEVLTQEEAVEIAAFCGVSVEKVRGIEVLVLMKAGRVKVAP